MADTNLVPDGIPATAEGDVFDGTLWSRMTGAETPERFAATWLEMQAQILGDVTGGVVVLGTPGTGPFTPIAHWPAGAEIGVNISMTAELALSKKQGVVRDIAGQEDDAVDRHAIAYPIVVDDQISGVAAFFPIRRRSSFPVRGRPGP